MPLDGRAALRQALTPLPVPWGVGPALRAALAAFSGEVRPVNAAEGAVIDAEREARLRALGYVR